MAQAKRKIADKFYVQSDGSEGRHATPETAELQFRFADDGGVLAVKLGDLGEGCQRAAAWHGIAQKVGDTYNKAETPEEAFDMAAAMVERLEGNEWIKPGEGAGPRVTMLVLAIVRALEADDETVDDERRDAIVQKLSGSDDTAVNKAAREGAMANPHIAAALKSIQAEAAMERADKAATDAKGVEADLGAF